MKKQIKVIRSKGKTMVIYSDEPRERKATEKPVMKQKPVPVFRDGKLDYYIMPSGKEYPVRRGMFWKVLKFIKPGAQFIA